MTTTISDRGQTVVPAAIRKTYHLTSASRLEWLDDGVCIRVVPLGKDPIAQVRGVFGKSRLTKALLRAREEERARD